MAQSSQAKSTLLGSLSQLGAGAVAILHTRLELFGLEWEEEYSRAVALLVLVAGAGILGFMALLVLSLLVAFAFEGAARLIAMGVLILIYGGLSFGCLWAAKLRLKRNGPAFAATLAELKRDRAMFLKNSVTTEEPAQ